MKEKRLDAPVFDFRELVGDDLSQHLGELHAQGLVHERVEAEVQQSLHHLPTQTDAQQLSERYIAGTALSNVS